MKFRNIIQSLVLLVSLAWVSSCDFGDLNVDPANPDAVPVQALLPTIEVRQAYLYGGDMARYNAMFTQHFNGVSRQSLVIGRYNFTSSDVNSAWNQMYRGAFRDLKVLIDLADAQGATHYSAVGKILQANMIGLASDMWGNVPFTEAGLGTENLAPAYDSRDEIYSSVHSLLQDARAALAVRTDLPVGSEDYFYASVNTDYAPLWIKAAFALDARYYLHRGDLVNALEAAKVSFASEAEELTFASFSESPTESHPLFQFIDQRGDTRMGEFFVELMKANSDPRLPFFVAEFGDTGEYIGVPAGDDSEGSEAGPFYNNRSATVPFISYSEVKFIEAEVLLRQGGDYQTPLREAIRSSVEVVTGVENDDFVDAQVASVTDLEGLILQKYVALFYQPETFNDLRRTGFPALSPAQGASQEQSGGDIPNRWPYPINEQLFNKENFDANNPSGPPLVPELGWE
ncbi:SusD/RagB family nutrient-binding outer membrane lipoprotein [Persicobacter sp. CCB-QB2]|uniref:SusD/RagB family nutrient-binding outer membrane lipoprotein n=1 Tax=Persicobacter sp. CCB-QB2 TaxID=1561025 RepID=UPI000A7AD176|nr:SusD/RagB family nutrient-binding outer membrane lipoprotein [Persicobacter sp. CCB-QB2]